MEGVHTALKVACVTPLSASANMADGSAIVAVKLFVIVIVVGVQAQVRGARDRVAPTRRVTRLLPSSTNNVALLLYPQRINHTSAYTKACTDSTRGLNYQSSRWIHCASCAAKADLCR